jgi:hypothetical protein
LIGYQFADPKKAGALLEGGLLQFSATLAVQGDNAEKVLTALRTGIAERRKSAKPPENLDPKGIRLSALPIKSAEVHLYTPNGEFLSGSPRGDGIAPTFATQKMVFSIPLSKVGTTVYDELVKGNTGVPVVVTFKYHGLTPPAGFKVKVNFKRAYEHYSRDQKFAARASWFGIWGGSVDISSKEIIESLKDSKAIEVEVIEGEGFKAADAEKYLQPILKRINDEILEASKPPEKINPAEAPKPSAGGWFSAGYSSATVRANYNIEKVETINFSVRQNVERATIASGFIGISRYPEALQKKLITFVGPGPFKSAFFVLPEVGDAAELGISQVDLSISLENKGVLGDPQLRTWSPKAGWMFQDRETSKLIAFPLANVARTDPMLRDLKFNVKTIVRMGGRWSIKSEETVNALNGDFPVAPPLEAFDVVEVNAGACTWKLLDGKGKSSLIQIDASIKDQAGKPYPTKAILPFNKDGKDSAPKPFFLLVPKSQQVLLPNIIFQSGSNRIYWKHNGKNLREFAPSLTLSLTDDDLREGTAK